MTMCKINQIEYKLIYFDFNLLSNGNQVPNTTVRSLKKQPNKNQIKNKVKIYI